MMGTVSRRKRASGILRGSASWIASNNQHLQNKAPEGNDPQTKVENHPLYVSTYEGVIWIQENPIYAGDKHFY
jgi:hypothetical protein